jgi:V8-like Glu-specific endopeptidase
MTENVKSLAQKDLLGPIKDNKDGKFVDADQQVLNFARKDVFKNASTKMPARLNKDFARYMDSVGLIACGTIRGTCFLVADKLVITNYHVYNMIKTERNNQQRRNLPITVCFNFVWPAETQPGNAVVTVEIDEGHDPKIDNAHLDYKFLRLKENQSLKKRVPLGTIVRCRPLEEGRVVIIGHPEGKEMHQETCVVVERNLWREKLEKRHKCCAGVHMTNKEKLESEKYKDCVPYDTSLFHGASGSPVFDMNGHIVAMHTQGYTLDGEEGKRSLMEFGVQFNVICKDVRDKRGLDCFKQLFPSYNSNDNQEKANERHDQEEPMDQG